MTRLALLWHMHQPFYVDLATGEHVLPWVRLHATKDYWGMAALLREFPRVRATFNLVPSLLVQVEAFAEDRAHDRHLQIGLQPADQLDEGERAFLVANGFHAPPARMIKPFARYHELYERRQRPESFGVADLRDLQVWHKLVWMDPDWLRTDRSLVALLEKGHGYTEADKQTLRAVELQILNSVIPVYRELASTGRIELSTSPFYHPILPLLCDTDTHFRAHPHSALPHRLFARPSDAAAQLDRAFAYHHALFGSRPAGVWPSEGSLSDEVIELLAARACRWSATDEDILARSLGQPLSASVLYRAYEVGRNGHSVRCVFRDHALSDLIGFAYQSWDAHAAADDFVAKVRDAGRRFAAAQPPGSGEVATVSVILDGENAWEHYPGGGRPFLRALYQRLQDAADIQTVTMSEAVAAPSSRLASVFPGSWINGDFYVWAGHADDHRAWAQLGAARTAFDEHAAGVAAARRDRAWEELLIAEGSDWFWWYGDDHASDHDRDFDELFRRHLRNVYRELGQPAAADLFVSNITTLPISSEPLAFAGFITPSFDSPAAEFADWVGAARVPLGGGGGTMHRVSGQLVRGLRVGVDPTTLYLQVEGADLARRFGAGELSLGLMLEYPATRRIELTAGIARSVDGRFVQAAVPFAALRVQTGDLIRLRVVVTDLAGHLIEQHPALEPMALRRPGRHVETIAWRV